MGEQTNLEKPVALEAYENFGSEYARVIRNNAYNANFERPTTISLMPDVRNKLVLDAGCGPGEYIDWLLKNGARAIGVDVSPSMIECAKARFAKTADLYLHDLSEGLPMFEDGFFDVVLSSLAIHYVRDLKRLFGEFNRILKQDGYLILSTHHPLMDFEDSPSRDYFSTEIIEQDWNTIGRPVRVRFFRRSLTDLITPLIDAGFVIECLNEGLLTAELKQQFPIEFERLSKKPPFIFLRLRKVA